MIVNDINEVCRSEEAGITRRQLGVLFRDLRVVGIGASASHLPTLGSVLNPFLIFERIQTARHPPLKDIISGFEGVVRPGEMLCEFLLLSSFQSSSRFSL